MTTSPTRLSDVCELINGGAWKQTEYVDDGIPVVQVSNMKNGTIDVSDLKFLPLTSYDRYKKHILKECDLVIATVGSHATQASAAGRATIVKGFAAGMLLNQNAVAIRSKVESLDQGYLGLIGRSDKFQFYLGTVGQGAANQVRIALSAIKEYKFNLPPIGVQRRIAGVISAYDDLIENNRRRVQLLEQAARLLYKEWFLHLRFPGHEHVKIKDGVPEGWEKKHLSELLNTQYGFTETATDEPVGPKFLRGKDINKTSYIDWSSVPYCPEDRLDFRKYALHVDDIVVIRMADPGKVAIVESELKAIFASYLVRLTRKERVSIPALYLFYVLSDDLYQGFISGASGGSTRKSASAKLLVDFNALIPPASLASLFVEQVQPLRSQIRTLLEQNASLREARDLLLPRLMSGEVAA